MAVDCCLNHDQRFKADPLNTLNLHHNFASTNAHGSRSENDRMECLCCSFLQHAENLGPNGLTICCSLHNGGNTNSQGRSHYAGNETHKNPTMSLCIVKVLLIFILFFILKEPFPYFSHPKNYYGTPILRRKSDRTKAVTRDLLCDEHMTLHKIIDYCSESGK